MRSIAQIFSSETVPWRISASRKIVNGRGTVPTMRSTHAKLASKMLEFVCNFLNFLTVTITNAFKTMIIGQAMVVTAIESCRESVCFRSQMNSGLFGQLTNTDLEEFARDSWLLPLTFMSINTKCWRSCTF